MGITPSGLEGKKVTLDSNGRSEGKLDILGICPHSVENLTATTGYGGVSTFFFQSLAQRHRVTLADVSVKGPMHYLNRLHSLVLQPRAWQQHANKNPWIFQERRAAAVK